MILVISSNPYRCSQSQSALALLSSKTSGQLSAGIKEFKPPVEYDIYSFLAHLFSVLFYQACTPQPSQDSIASFH